MRTFNVKTYGQYVTEYIDPIFETSDSNKNHTANKVDIISEENLIENSNVRDNEKEDMGLNEGKDYQTNRKRKREREKCESKQNDLEV